MSKEYDVVYGEKYTANGQEKTRWIRCGAVFGGDKGFSLKLDCVPVNCTGWFSLFPPKESEPAANDVTRSNRAQGGDGYPF